MVKWDFERVEQAFTGASVDPQHWVKALDAIASVTGSVGAILLPLSGDLIPNVPFTETIHRWRIIFKMAGIRGTNAIAAFTF